MNKGYFLYAVARALNGPHYLDELTGTKNMQQARVEKWNATDVGTKRKMLQLARMAIAQVESGIAPACLERPAVERSGE